MTREAASVDRLVEHCAGLPLGLAIVAGRAAMTPQLPLSVLVDELDDDTTRLDGLCSGEPGSDVRATLDASVSVLSAPAVAAFGLMGLAPGPSLSARGFVALSGLSGPIATAALRDLTATHLVTQERPGRYQMHELVRLYAAALGRRDPQAGTAVRRLLQHFLDGADTSTAGPDFVSVEAPSMIAAVDLAVREGYDLLGCDMAAALEAHLSSRRCWRDLVRVNTSAAAAARRRNDPGRLVRALVGLGRGRIGLRQFDGASIDLELALQIADDLRASGLLAAVHRALARLAAHQNRHDQALPHDERALELHLAIGNLAGQATAYNAIGWHQAHLGEPERGLENSAVGHWRSSSRPGTAPARR